MSGYEEKFTGKRLPNQNSAAYNMTQSYQGGYSQRFEPFPGLNNGSGKEKLESQAGGISAAGKGKDKADSNECLFVDKKTKFPNLIASIKEYHKDLIQTNPPQLSKNAEQQLSQNYRQTIIAEGNLHSTVPNAKSLLITSSFPKEGKTISAIFLAHSLAVLSGRKVLLVDTNFRSPKIHLFYSTNVPCSLLDAMSDLDSIPRHILPTKYENLYILPHSVGDRMIGSIKKQWIKDFIDCIEPWFDYILFDGVAIMSAPETVIIAQAVDAVLFVVECENTKWEVVQGGIEKVLNVSGKVAGIILNKRKYYLPKWVYKII